MLTRRSFLASLAVSAAFANLRAQAPSKPEHSGSFLPSAEDLKLLDDIQQTAYLYFWEQADKKTGLVKDRAKATGFDDRTIGSIAATGFGLTGLAIAHARGFGEKKKIEERVGAALTFLWNKLHHEHGFYFHFLDIFTGERMWKCELSTIDTSLLLCGVLYCRAYFPDAAIKELATNIYERVDWPWFLNGGDTFSMGWKPESGFLKSRWDSYSELMMVYLLALGSPTHPVPPACWKAWKRTWVEYEGIRYISAEAPLFIHQFSHAWFDFRHVSDGEADYFANSIKATLAHKLFCENLAKRYKDYSSTLWGITASDSAQGYVVWGGPPAMGPIDGSVVPCAAGGSLAFIPQYTLPVLHSIRK